MSVVHLSIIKAKSHWCWPCKTIRELTAYKDWSSPSKHKDKFGQGYFHHLFQCKCNLDRFCSYCNLLLRSGEDINLTDSLGKPPAFVFCEKALANVRGADETTNILQFLQSIGVYFQGTDDRGKNILHYLFSKYANPALYLACPCSMCVMNHRTWELPPEVDMAITSIYYFLIKNNDIDCFHNDERGESPFMLAMQNRAEFSFMKDLLSRPIPLQYNKFGENCFHYLARSYASETKFALIKAELVKNHIPYDPNHLRPPHVVPGSGAGWCSLHGRCCLYLFLHYMLTDTISSQLELHLFPLSIISGFQHEKRAHTCTHACTCGHCLSAHNFLQTNLSPCLALWV